MSTDSLQIRPLAATDELQWRRLWSGYLKFYETSVPEEVYAATFARLAAQDQPDISGYLAFVDGVCAGLVHCVDHAFLWKVENVCYLHDLYTVPEFRNKGVARALIETVYCQARSRGIDTVYWLTHETNAPARLLYDGIANRSGFIEYSKDLSNP